MSNQEPYWNRPGTRRTANSQAAAQNNTDGMENDQTPSSSPRLPAATPATGIGTGLPQDQRSTTPASLSGFDLGRLDLFDTPIGAGVNHLLQTQRMASPRELLAVDAEEFERLIQTESQNVQRLGEEDYTETEGWENTFEAQGANIEGKIAALLNAAKTKKAYLLMNRLYVIRRELQNHLKSLREAKSLKEQDAGRSGPRHDEEPEPHSRPESRGSTLPAGINPIPPNDHRDDEDEDLHHDALPLPADPPQENFNAVINTLRCRLKVVEESRPVLESLFSNLTENVQSVQANKVGKPELDLALQRICQLELNSSRPNHVLEERVNSNTQICRRIQEEDLFQVIGQLRETVAGLTEDNVELTRRLTAVEGIADVVISGNNTRGNQPQPATSLSSARSTEGSNNMSLPHTSEQPSYITGFGQLHSDESRPLPPPILPIMSSGRTITTMAPSAPAPMANSSRLHNERPPRSQQNTAPPDQNLNNTNSDSINADTGYAEYVKSRLHEAGLSILSILQPEIDSTLSKNKVASLHKSTLNAVCSERRELEKLINKYERFPKTQIDTSALFRAGEILTEARDWCTRLINRYDELDCANKPVDRKLFEGLGTFTEDSEVSIYEFLKKFDTYMEDTGSKADRAALLYEQHLDDNIKLLTVDLRADLDRLKAWLINRFGDPKNMCDNILKPISKGNPPSDTTVTSSLLHHYRNLNAAIKKIEELWGLPNIPLDSLNSHIESNAFLHSIVDLLPAQANMAFYEQLYKEDLNMIKIQGARTWGVLTRVIRRLSIMMEGRAKSAGVSLSQKQKQTPKAEKDQPKKTKSAHATTKEDDEVQILAHHTGKSSTPKSNKKNHQNTEASKPTKSNNASKEQKDLDFPCPVFNHRHELGQCKSFFSAKARKRMLMAEGRCCFTCLKPYSNCKSGCQTKLPTILVCKGCEPEAKKINKSPLNVIICPYNDHKTNLNELNVQKALVKYLTGFDPSILADGKTVINHVLLGAHASNACAKCHGKCMCNLQSNSSKPDPKKETPNIDTYSGERMEIDEALILEESENDAFYVMQTLHLGGQDVLTFYDRGANHHMIKGELAEDIDLKVITDQPINIGVVGGGKVWTKFGTYSVSLGPTKEGYFHKISAQGIDKITDMFPRYFLKDINKEVKTIPELKAEALPQYIGGQEAGLLIGVKNTALEPHLIFQLPCGLGIFESPIKDKFGARICYGGPHELFTEVNRKSRGFNHVSFHFMQMINQYKNSLYPALSAALEPCMKESVEGVLVPTNNVQCTQIRESNFCLYASPVDASDMQEMGIPVEVPEDNPEEDCTCGGFYSSVIMMEGTTAKSVHKAKVPLAKKKEYFDQDDIEQTHAMRCEDCTKCKKCGQSAKTRMISLQEKIEQEAIEASVKIDIDEQKALVDLPFLKDPITSLKAKHHGNDSNYYQAAKVYKQQCKQPEQVKEVLNKVHADLIDRGFMKRFDHLSKEQQTIIKESGFRHVMPWRVAEKPDSLSTPYRMVVDATMSGLNQILAKGENRMQKITSILIRNRCHLKMWSSDISKLYNQLHLQPAALPFCLFLFKKDLNIDEDPEVYVMVRAWYGVAPVGNQAAEALKQLTSILEETHPVAKRIVETDVYVDDFLSGADTDQEVEDQILEIKDALKHGGFSLKYVVKSGSKPCPEASSDGESLKILGYVWKPEEDILQPGFGELNFNKKKRGAKKPNKFPVVSPDDVTKVLKDVKISRRIVVAKMGEFYDPSGIWEPYKLQLKLDIQYLKGMDWDVELPQDLQEHWTQRFKEMLEVPYFSALRCVVPPDAVDPSKMRLLCLADAAEEAGGCCIYAGFLKKDGSYSCALLLSRSKLMNQKVPRNELEAIRIMAETASAVKEALGEKVAETVYVTDSTIALCWCNNLQKKLKVYTLFRVAEIRRNILGKVLAAEDHKMPLYHIEGNLNPADLVTKRHDITPDRIGPGSSWQNGEPWMSLPTNQMPLTTYADLKLTKAEESEITTECFPEVIMSKAAHTTLQEPFEEKDYVQDNARTTVYHCQGCQPTPIYTPMDVCHGATDILDHCLHCKCSTSASGFALKRGGNSEMLIDIVKYGWKQSLKILAKLYELAFEGRHKLHVAQNQIVSDCRLCPKDESVAEAPNSHKSYFALAVDYIYRQETRRILATKKKGLEQYIMKDGILYYESRLQSELKTENIDCEVFFDKHEIKQFLPVVLSDSDVFFAYVMHVHHHILPHAGVEMTMKEVSKIMMVINNPRKVIQAIRHSCPACRLIHKKTVELRMLPHPDARTILAPPFYIAQVDTVFGFKAQVFKDARKTVKIYALIICCLLTGATNILVIEGLETTDVLQAIERHAFRHGMPKRLYVDNGTNLVALQHATFSIRDLDTHLQDSYGVQVIVSNAKSHEERGRVEARVKILRKMLEKLSIKADSAFSVLQWENIFSKISNMMNDLPIAKCTRSNAADPGWDIITPNRLQLGRNNMRSLEGNISLSKSIGSTNLLRKNQAIMSNWYQIFTNRIHHLIPRPNKWTKDDKIQVGDICLFMYNEAPGVGKDYWKLGRITDIPKPNKVIIAFPNMNSKLKKTELPAMKTITRCPRDISIIHAADEIDMNTREYLENLFNRT